MEYKVTLPYGGTLTDLIYEGILSSAKLAVDEHNENGVPSKFACVNSTAHSSLGSIKSLKSLKPQDSKNVIIKSLPFSGSSSKFDVSYKLRFGEVWE